MNNASIPSVNVASHLARLAVELPDRVAIYYPRRGVNLQGVTEYDKLTFRQLHHESDAVAHALAHIGTSPGTRVVIMVPPCLEFFSLVFGLFKTAAVPVLIDPGLGISGIGSCLAEAQPELFIGVPKAHLARRLFGWCRYSVRTSVNVGRGRFFCHHRLHDLTSASECRRPYDMPKVSPGDTAAVLFTSGSTGPAKGAVYTHGNFAGQVEVLRSTFRIAPGEIDLCTFPLFALFGPALGMTCVVPDMDFTRPGTIDVRKAIAQIDQFEVTNLFGSPAVLRAFGAWYLGHGYQKPAPPTPAVDGVQRPPGPPRFSSLRRVISAGAAVPATTIERFARMLPEHAEVLTPYGATEALPVACIGSKEILTETRHYTDKGQGVCVGRPVAGLEVRVITIRDEPIEIWDTSDVLSAGSIGEFVVRGSVVTPSYLNRPEATALAKIRDGDSFWHRMGDIGYIDDTGRLWYCGRKSHRVVTPTGTLYTEMVEGVFNTIEGVFRTALVGVTRRSITYPVVCVERLRPHHTSSWGHAKVRFVNDWQSLVERLHQIALSTQNTSQISTFLDHPGFPVDIRHNSKIFREKLAVWADRTLGPKWDPGLTSEGSS